MSYVPQGTYIYAIFKSKEKEHFRKTYSEYTILLIILSIVILFSNYNVIKCPLNISELLHLIGITLYIASYCYQYNYCLSYLNIEFFLLISIYKCLVIYIRRLTKIARYMNFD